MNLNFTKQKSRIFIGVFLAVCVVALFALTEVKWSVPRAKAQGVSEVRFRNVRVDGLTNLRGAVTMGSVLDVENDVAVGGDLAVTGVITTEGGYIGITPVPTATAQPTATPALLYGATPAAVKEVCKQVSVIGAATVTFAGISTPQAVTYGIAADPGGNVDLATHTNATGVVTVKTWKVLSGTPEAATTAVPVDVCVRGN